MASSDRHGAPPLLTQLTGYQVVARGTSMRCCAISHNPYSLCCLISGRRFIKNLLETLKLKNRHQKRPTLHIVRDGRSIWAFFVMASVCIWYRQYMRRLDQKQERWQTLCGWHERVLCSSANRMFVRLCCNIRIQSPSLVVAPSLPAHLAGHIFARNGFRLLLCLHLFENDNQAFFVSTASP